MMPLDDQIKAGAERFWDALLSRTYLSPYRAKDKYSPENFWAIERAFESIEPQGENKLNGLFNISTQSDRTCTI